MQERADDAALIQLGLGGKIQRVNAVQGTVCPRADERFDGRHRIRVHGLSQDR